jgi:8-oxo-dGTP diphosphatase
MIFKDSPEGMQTATLIFLLKGEPVAEILLGYKKVGFGAGKFAGFGGKVEPGEEIAGAALRELFEEAGILLPAVSIKYAAVLTFIFPHKPQWNQQVHVFTSHNWEGRPTESREMRPQWFPVESIPYGQMWDDAKYWLPRVISGERLTIQVTFKADNQTVENIQLERKDASQNL